MDLHTPFNYEVVAAPECVWSDGQIGGYCCELYCGDLEVGNLVNTLGVSTDVGFGYERIVQVVEGRQTVHETSLFQQGMHPVLADHVRTLELFVENNIPPGNRGRDYVCKRLLRRCIRLGMTGGPCQDWLEAERSLLDDRLRQGRRMMRKHLGQSDQWWWETVGILPEERQLLS